MVLKDYQEVAMKHLWTLNGGGASSNDVYKAVNETMPAREHDSGRTTAAISRASIINFLNAMVDEGVLSYTERTGKGGHRRIYVAKYNESGFKQWIAETVLKKLLHYFPDETQLAIQSLNKKDEGL